MCSLLSCNWEHSLSVFPEDRNVCSEEKNIHCNLFISTVSLSVVWAPRTCWTKRFIFLFPRVSEAWCQSLWWTDRAARPWWGWHRGPASVTDLGSLDNRTSCGYRWPAIKRDDDLMWNSNFTLRGEWKSNSVFRRTENLLGVLPYMGYIGICGPKGFGFLVVLIRNRISILAILVSNRVWFLHSSLELGMFF